MGHSLPDYLTLPSAFLQVPIHQNSRESEGPCSSAGVQGAAYTGRFFKTPFSLCPCPPHDGSPCSCVVSPAVVLAFSAACAAWPQATDGLVETALAMAPAIRLPVASPPLARLRRARTAVRGRDSSD